MLEQQDVQTAADLTEEDQKVIADATAKHGRKVAYWFDEDFGLVVVAKPIGAQGKANYHRLVNELQDPDVNKALALEQFALACVFYPTREEAKKIFEDNPAFALKAAARAQQLAGSQVKELGKV